MGILDLPATRGYRAKEMSISLVSLAIPHRSASARQPGPLSIAPEKLCSETRPILRQYYDVLFEMHGEQHWWPGPTACTGALSAPVDVKDLMKALETTRVVNCDEVQLRILGLSLAGWDVVASAALAIYAALAARLVR